METVDVYYRKESGKLGYINVELNEGEGHKEGIFTVKEWLVGKGECLTNRPILVAIKGGKSDVTE